MADISSQSTARLRIHNAAVRIFAEAGGSVLAISDLAKEAGLARGTVYNNLENPESLLDAVCKTTLNELDDSLTKALKPIADPAERIAAIIILSLRRTHEEPDWGRFLARYAIIDPRIGSFWAGIPRSELLKGLEAERFAFERKQLASVTAVVGGSTLGAMSLILDGHRSWRQAGEETAEIVLRGIGLSPKEASKIASMELAPLPRLNSIG